MPLYEYEHKGDGCELGKGFEWRQPIAEDALKKCPECGKPVKRLISLVGINTPKGNSQLRDLGFTKLVRRDDGTYENVTARKGESKTVDRSNPSTYPDLKKTIAD